MLLFLISNYIFGWTYPTENPPGGNITPSFSQWTTSGSDIYYIDGNVGVGTDSPKTLLEVAGAIKIGTETTCNTDTEGAIRYNSDNKQFESCYGNEWKVVYSEQTPPGSFTCGSNIAFTYNGNLVIYGTVESQGRCWMDRNLGALGVATAYNDSSAYGDLFQWGRLDDGHQVRTSGTTGTRATSDTPGHSNFITHSASPYDWRNPQNDNFWQGVNGINNPCPPGWRIPTGDEWDAERLSWGTNNAAGAYASPLKLTVGGNRGCSNGLLGTVGSYGYYWGATVSGTNAQGLYFLSSTAAMGTTGLRADGRSVRCIKDEQQPDLVYLPPREDPGFICGRSVNFVYKGTRVTYGTVYSQGRCWMDRNLGALGVATKSDDANAYGDLFQWGRLDDGHQVRTSGTTTTLSSSDIPGHSNFITIASSPYDWRNPQNNNLWQGVNGINNPCPPGWRIPTEAEWDTERQSWSTNNAAGAYTSPLKLTVGGRRNYNTGSLYDVGGTGRYWSASVSGALAQFLNFTSSLATMTTYYRAYGASVRCLKD